MTCLVAPIILCAPGGPKLIQNIVQMDGGPKLIQSTILYDKRNCQCSSGPSG
jgi:hypothetical protein